VSSEKIGYLLQRNQELWNIIVEIIEEGKRSGIFRNDVNSSETSVLLWSASNGIILTMDHMTNSHKAEDFKFTNDSHSKEFINTFFKIDYMSMLYRTWDILLNSIRNVKNNNN
jgi:hypothetical protein